MLFRPRKSTAHGSAGWTPPPRQLLTPRFRPQEPGVFFLGEKGRYRITLPLEQMLKHGVVIGGSGTGKSRGFFLPNAASAHNTSLVCTDPKGELWRYTSGFHPEAVRFAPAEPGRSAPFNWIPLCKDPRRSELCARAVVESGNTERTEQCWLDLETSFLSALFSHASFLPAPTPLTAYQLFTHQPQKLLLQQLLASPSEAAREQAMIFQQTSERMRGSIVPVVAARLQFLRDPAVARTTSATLKAPDFGLLRRQPYAVYWCLQEQDIARLRPLTALFFTLLLDQIGHEEIPEGESSVPVLMLLDEFANIGALPHFETTISVSRGRGVGLWLGIQGLSQMEARYGKANAETILTNCSTKIALNGLDVRTGEYISRSLGESTVVSRKKARHRRWLFAQNTGSTLSITEHGRPLLTADEVRRVGTDEAIVLVGNQRPMLLKKHFYNEAPREAPCGSLGPAQAIDLPLTALPITHAWDTLRELPPLPAELLGLPWLPR